MTGIKTLKINIQDIKPAPYNPRVMSKQEQQKLKQGLQTFGLVDPIIIDLTDQNTVIGGHQRLEVLQEIDDNQTLTVIPLGDIGLVIRETELTIKDKTQQKALNLALNKIHGDWDYSKLDEVLEELVDTHIDIDLTGFEDYEITDYLLDDNEELEDMIPEGTQLPSQEIINEQEENNTTHTPIKEIEQITKDGEQYAPKGYTLLYIDNTEKQHIEKLLSPEKVEVTLTNTPPKIDIITKGTTT